MPLLRAVGELRLGGITIGLSDSHWCSNCGKEIDKRGDEYVECNFNNWKGGHINYKIIHKPSGKEKRRVRTKGEAEVFINNIPKGKLKDKDPKNYEVKCIARKMKKVEHVHDRVFLCRPCYNKHIEKEVEMLRRKGNPIFHCSVICWAWKECAFYEPPETPPIPHTTTPIEKVNAGEPERFQEPNCRHIAAADDVIYCLRRHPGAVVLTLEDSVIQQRRMNEYPIFASELVERMKKSFKTPEVREQYLSAFTDVERLKKGAEFDAAVNMACVVLDQQVKETDHGSSFYKSKPGDIELYTDICPEKIITETPKKEEKAVEGGEQHA